ncbi:MAG: DUF6356 family protein [Caulobacteraceae bacterium]
MLRRLFLNHPAAMNETYGEHMGVALSFAGRLFAASAACAVHALVPGLFVTTGSRAIADLNTRLVEGRRSATARGVMAGTYSI